jgi:hypothetical protein
MAHGKSTMKQGRWTKLRTTWQHCCEKWPLIVNGKSLAGTMYWDSLAHLLAVYVLKG